MPEFVLPVFPDDLPPDRFFVSVWSSFDLSVEEEEGLRRVLGENLLGHHTIREQVEFAGKTAEVRALIGIHGPRPQQETDLFEDASRTHWIHFSLDFTAGIRPRNNQSQMWAVAYEALRNTVSSRVFDVNAFWSFPKDSSTFAVALPILLQGDIPGFTEIRGVRLSEPDPDDPTGELYSLILDHYGNSASAQVRTTLDSDLSGDLLKKAMDRAIAIVRLAVEPIQDHG